MYRPVASGSSRQAHGASQRQVHEAGAGAACCVVQSSLPHRCTGWGKMPRRIHHKNGRNTHPAQHTPRRGVITQRAEVGLGRTRKQGGGVSTHARRHEHRQAGGQVANLLARWQIDWLAGIIVHPRQFKHAMCKWGCSGRCCCCCCCTVLSLLCFCRQRLARHCLTSIADILTTPIHDAVQHGAKCSEVLNSGSAVLTRMQGHWPVSLGTLAWHQPSGPSTSSSSRSPSAMGCSVSGCFLGCTHMEADTDT